MDIGLPSAAMGAAVSGGRFAIWLRLLFPLALLEAALWTPPPLAILCGISALCYMSWHLWRSALGNAGGLGLELHGVLRESWLLGATFAVALAMLATAYFSGSLHRLWGLQNPWYAIVGYSCWALVQQFMLQCFCLRLLSALVSRAYGGGHEEAGGGHLDERVAHGDPGVARAASAPQGDPGDD